MPSADPGPMAEQRVVGLFPSGTEALLEKPVGPINADSKSRWRNDQVMVILSRKVQYSTMIQPYSHVTGSLAGSISIWRAPFDSFLQPRVPDVLLSLWSFVSSTVSVYLWSQIQFRTRK